MAEQSDTGGALTFLLIGQQAINVWIEGVYNQIAVYAAAVQTKKLQACCSRPRVTRGW